MQLFSSNYIFFSASLWWLCASTSVFPILGRKASLCCIVSNHLQSSPISVRRTVWLCPFNPILDVGQPRLAGHSLLSGDHNMFRPSHPPPCICVFLITNLFWFQTSIRHRLRCLDRSNGRQWWSGNTMSDVAWLSLDYVSLSKLHTS